MNFEKKEGLAISIGGVITLLLSLFCLYDQTGVKAFAITLSLIVIVVGMIKYYTK